MIAFVIPPACATPAAVFVTPPRLASVGVAGRLVIASTPWMWPVGDAPTCAAVMFVRPLPSPVCSPSNAPDTVIVVPGLPV